MFVLFGFIYIYRNDVYILSFTFYVITDEFRTIVIEIHI
jgi:hypothetical protein